MTRACRNRDPNHRCWTARLSDVIRGARPESYAQSCRFSAQRASSMADSARCERRTRPGAHRASTSGSAEGPPDRAEPADLCLHRNRLPGRRRCQWCAAQAGRRIARVLALMCALGVSTLAAGQERGDASARLLPLARFVPAETRLYITVPRLGPLSETLIRTGADGYAPLGAADDHERPFNLARAITGFLGPESSVPFDDLKDAELGIVADSWSRLGSAVWLVRLTNDSLLDTWFPVEGRLHDLRSRHGVRFIWTGDGLNLCVREGVLALARRGGGRSLLAGVRRLMNEPSGTSRERSAEFEVLRARLPARHLAMVDVAGDQGNPTAEGVSPLLWPDVHRAVVGLYERRGRIELAVSGSLKTPGRRTPLAPEAVDRIAHLPQTTLMAWATAVDFPKARSSATHGTPDGALDRYLGAFATVGGDRAVGAKLFELLGPNVIFAWEPNLKDPGGAPQVALLVQCTDARGVRAEATYIAGSLLRALRTIDPVDAAVAPKVKLSLHLGTPILHVSLRDYAKASRFPLARLLATTEPAWATVGEWAIFALSREHMQRILDAQNELIPTLATFREVQELTARRQQRNAVAVVQVALAADLLRGWLQAYESGTPSLLDPSWWTPPRRDVAEPEAQFGIVLAGDGPAGVVIVADVLAGSPSEGRLLPEDRILGVDGRFLDLSASTTDLRRRLSDPGIGGSVKLRVQRGDTLRDVELKAARSSSPLESLLLEPADALRELASLGGPLEFATFETLAAGEERYLAQLSLRFASPPQP